MQAVRLHPPGRIEDLRLEEIDTPQGGPGQVLVRVHPAAITRGELRVDIDSVSPSPKPIERSGQHPARQARKGGPQIAD
jgi:NADPH:quinone reductase-like Zn-dependent oxidoreductase